MTLDTELIVRGRPLGLAQLLAQAEAKPPAQSAVDDINTDALWPGKYTYVQNPARGDARACL